MSLNAAVKAGRGAGLPRTPNSSQLLIPGREAGRQMLEEANLGAPSPPGDVLRFLQWSRLQVPRGERREQRKCGRRGQGGLFDFARRPDPLCPSLEGDAPPVRAELPVLRVCKQGALDWALHYFQELSLGN